MTQQKIIDEFDIVDTKEVGRFFDDFVLKKMMMLIHCSFMDFFYTKTKKRNQFNTLKNLLEKEMLMLNFYLQKCSMKEALVLKLIKKKKKKTLQLYLEAAEKEQVSYILHDKDLTAEISASSTAKGEITIHFQKILMSPVLEILLLNYSFQQKDDAIASFLFSILFLVISMFKMEFLQFDVIHFHISRILVQLFLIFQH